MNIGMCYDEVYCADCCHIEGFNGCKPLSQPTTCSICGGIMVHNKSEEEDITTFLHMWDGNK